MPCGDSDCALRPDLTAWTRSKRMSELRMSTKPQHNGRSLESASMLSKKTENRRNRRPKWKRTILLGAFFCAITLIINIVVVIIGSRSTLDSDGYRRTLYHGDCGYARRLNSIIHLVINSLSTVLLASSNYTMQCLSAPTRTEVDRAHGKREWLDMGILSLRNLKRVARIRTLFWALLAASSLSLHFVFNSVFHTSLSTYDYHVYQANLSMLELSPAPFWDFPTGQDVLETMHTNNKSLFYYADPLDRLVAREVWKELSVGKLDKLENADCIREYASTLIDHRRHLILVIPPSNITLGTKETEFSLFNPYGCSKMGYDWICSPSTTDSCVDRDQCMKDIKVMDPREWTAFGGLKPEYCLSESVPQSCSVRFSPSLAWVVIAFNVMKLVLLLTCWAPRGPLAGEQPLLTAGDAISSFIQRSDDTTNHLSAMGTFDLGRWSQGRVTQTGELPATEGRLAKIYYPWKRYKLLHAVPLVRWIVLTLLFLIISIVMWHFFRSGVGQVESASQVLAIPLGAVDPRTLLQGDGQMQRTTEQGFVGGVLLANLPQFVLSLIYCVFNRVLTTIAFSVEVNRFSLRRKGLRVSPAPQGAQRSTYFLQLPYRFALPIMVFSGFLHWLCSQSFFLVSIIEQIPVAENDSVSYEPKEFLTWGYSLQAILILALLAMAMYMVLIGVGLRSFASEMPVCGSCSAVISAMCHPPRNEDGDEAIYKPLMWGVTTEEMQAGMSVVECSFSSGEVRRPVEDDMVTMLAYTGKASYEWTM